MGFYFSKSFHFGPLRLNLSRAGFGVSIGVRGIRIGINRFGIYISLSRGSLRYRTYLSGRKERVAEEIGRD